MSIDVEIGRTAAGGRQFPIAFRVEFLRRWDECVEYGSKTRLLREYGLVEATVRGWLQARAEGKFTESMVTAAERSRSHVTNQERAELARLRAENKALKAKVAQGEAAQEILGKAFELLEGINTSSTPEPQIPPALMSASEYAAWLKRHNLS